MLVVDAQKNIQGFSGGRWQPETYCFGEEHQRLPERARGVVSDSPMWIRSEIWKMRFPLAALPLLHMERSLSSAEVQLLGVCRVEKPVHFYCT